MHEALSKLHDAKRELDEVLAALNEAQRLCVGLAPDAIMFLHEAKQEAKQARNRITIKQSEYKSALNAL